MMFPNARTLVDPSAAPRETTGPIVPAPGVWEDFKYPKKSPIRQVLNVLAIAILLMAMIGLVAWRTRNPLVIVSVIGLYFLAHITFSIVLLLRQKRKARRFVELASSANSFFPGATDNELINITYHPYRSKMVKQLTARGMHDVTVRTWLKKQPATPVPLNVQFEPKHLNEAEDAFREFHSAAKLEDVATDAGGRAAKPSKYRGTISRSLAVGGPAAGMLVVGIQGFRVVVESFVRGRILFGSALIGVFVVIFAVVFFLRGGWSTFEYLIVPGGLLRRRSTKSKRHAGLHLFRRTQSLLWVNQFMSHSWTVSVGDGTEFAVFRATTPEVDALLRAWLSPIDPPPLEKLKDFQ